MMGRAQEQWLSRNLRASKAQWNVLANQVMLAQVARGTPEAPTYAMYKWDGYVAARERLLRTFRETASHPVVVTGDVHSSWVADLKANFADPSSATLATEFIGTSMTSGGDGSEGALDRIQSMNPHVKFYNGRRGYVRVTLTPDACRADYRLLPIVTTPGASIDTRASFVVEHARKGVQPA
jgi:alkaline phosphatase D